ncbi:(S)-benzoin forming benzil reductase [Alkalihalobacillus sp. LMS39]|uniref:(S)-benzoin forming benzil reductase n=1 Tax=Alkalihalobacillus sp. LMS39 TaxID=2924032 RepID=UPI001FB2DE79|nr:(S)-benzoin forming benzil reductase [Alkalihalobacillus sp. LMS39]UOE95459.1 (S)-benzoin forming benzil reductase [Alkalihalobacillus sp. LMS39]
MKHFIITGASRGLGAALTSTFIEAGNHLYCIARSKNEELIQRAKTENCRIDWFQVDLNDSLVVESTMKSIFEQIWKQEVDELVLINNAGMIQPIKRAERCTAEEVETHFHVNLVAPIVLTANFIKSSLSFNGAKQVINISSGAGKHPISGWSAYCSAKAGLDLYSRTVAMEQTEAPYPVKVLSFSPGIIDTDMQSDIRSANKDDFAQIEKFIDYKQSGQLQTPFQVASIIKQIVSDPSIEQGALLSVHDFR